MLTIDDAMTLASNSTKLKPATEDQNLFDRFELDKTPILREFLSGMRLALKRCKNTRIGLEVVAEHNVHILHKEIAVNPAFKSALRNAERSNSQERHWYAQHLLDHEQIHLSLLTAYAGQPVPLHDHPESNGILLVLSGKIQVSRYDVTQKPHATEYDVALDKINDRLMGSGETDLLMAHRGNIHGMRSLTQRCIVLEILLPPPAKDCTRSWFLPTSEYMTSSSHLFARKVEGEYFLPL